MTTQIQLTSNMMSALVGRKLKHTFKNSLTIEMKIKDAKQSYGSIKALVEPVHGSGEAWVILQDEVVRKMLDL